MEAHKSIPPSGPTIKSLSETEIDHGCFINCHIQSRKLTALIDTGSNVTILKTSEFNHISSYCEIPIQPVNIQLVTATGETSPFYGKAKMTIDIGGNVFEHEILIADIKTDVILGRDFLFNNGCDILLSQMKLIINGQKIDCFLHDSSIEPTCARIATTEFIEIPPQTEIIVNAKPIDPFDRYQTSVVEGKLDFIDRSGVLVGKVLVCPLEGLIPVRLANIFDETLKINKCTVIGNLCPTEVVPSEYVQEVNIEMTTQNTNEIPSYLEDTYKRGSAELTNEQKLQFKELLIKNQDVFSKTSTDIGFTKLVEYTIDTGDSPPVRTPPYRLPLEKRKIAEQEITKLLNQGIIEPCSSPWLSPLILVPKPDGSTRVVIDYRKINTKIKYDSHPLPRIDSCLEALANNKYFSSLDMKQAFHQIGISEKDKPKTAFSFGSNTYMYTRMPFGMSTCPAVFERLMEKCFAGLAYNICLIYLDDLLCYSKSFDDHLLHLDKMFQRVRDANLKLSPNKCNFFQKIVSFLGHQISEAGIQPCPKKIKAVAEWPTPKNTKEVRSIVGLASFYRKMIPGFAEIAKPLHRLTEKGKTFTWNNECQNSFQKLKELLTSSPIIAYPVQGEPYTLECDASKFSIGSVLNQVQNGEQKVIGYYSRCLTRAERNYCTTRRELLSIICSIRHFHHFIYGAHFNVITDHGSLKWLLRFNKNCEGQLARWLEILGQYDFTVQYRPGKISLNSDALSRRPCSDNLCKYCTRIEEIYLESCDCLSTELLNDKKPIDSEIVCTTESSDSITNCDQDIPSIESLQNIAEIQKQDPKFSMIRKWVSEKQKPTWQEISKYDEEIKYYWQNFDRLKLCDDILYMTDETNILKPSPILTIVPNKLRKVIFDQLHSSVTAGHLGIRKTTQKVLQRFSWFKLRQDITYWCNTCDQCARRKTPPRKAKAPMTQYNVGMPLERIAIDLQGPYPKSKRGNKYILVVGDYFTKWVDAIPLKNTTAEYVAKKLVNKFISIFGVPLELHSDQGTTFESNVFQETCKILGIHKTRTTAARPISDGMIERANRTIENMLAAYVSDNQLDWCTHLPLLMLAYRSSIHESTGVTPCAMMFGRQINLPIDLVMGRPVDNTRTQTVNYVYELENKLTEIHDYARTRLDISSYQMKRLYDRVTYFHQYDEGDIVWYHDPRRTKGISPKLQRPWTGPMVIIKKINDCLYKIQKQPRSPPKVVHHDRLKPYTGNDKPTWYKQQ